MADMIWRGSRELHEEPGSPRRRKDADGTTVTRVFTGPYEDLVDNEPGINDVMEGFGGEILVKTVETIPLEAGPAGPGRMTVTADDKSDAPPDDGGGHPPSTIEIEWVQLEKSITEHPYFTNALTADAINQIVTAAEAGDPLPAFGGGGGQTEATGLYNRLRQGVDSYLVFSPVVRKTTPLTDKPTGQSAGSREAPPETPSGTWEYLKTADRSVSPGQDSKWERVEEWTGADVWDPILYPA